MNPEVTIDFETRSPVNLKDQGAFVYAADPATTPICLSAAVNADRPVVWINPRFRHLCHTANIQYEIVPEKDIFSMILDSKKIIAQNSMFEFLIWNWIMTSRFNWPVLELSRLHDTMAQSAYHALPLNLENSGAALGLTIQKDMTGHRAMMKICKPRTPKKKEKEEDPCWKNKLYWHEDPIDYEAVVNYCCHDVLTERMLHHSLPDLPPAERMIWLMDQVINLRGVCVDVDAARIITRRLEDYKDKQEVEFQRLTQGMVSGPKSYVALQNWVSQRIGRPISSVDKAAVAELLKTPLPEDVQKVLMIKTELSKSSTAKHQAIINRAGADNRFRGIAQYHGASTGRWAGRGVQVHNLPRDSYSEKDYELCLYLLNKGDLVTLEQVYGNPFSVASRCVRGTFIAAPGKELLCGDYSAIEGRNLAHLAQEEWVLEAYRAKKDMYKVAAAAILGKSYDDITKAERNAPGKIAELACGYQGAAGAVRQFGGGVGMTDEEIVKTIISPWRKSRPKTVDFWYETERAAIMAVENPGQETEYSYIKFHSDIQFLRIFLPSGRALHYYAPEIQKTRARRKNPREDHPQNCICDECAYDKKYLDFMGMQTVGDSTVPVWTRCATYGGRLVENIVQATCRDILAEAMLRLTDAGFHVVLHIHDEIVCEEEKGSRSLREFYELMEVVPTWAAGMPINVSGWQGYRYRKD